MRNTWPKMSGEEQEMDGWSFLVGRFGVNGYIRVGTTLGADPLYGYQPYSPKQNNTPYTKTYLESNFYNFGIFIINE